MLRVPPKTAVPPEKFKAVFPTLKPTAYNDPAAVRGSNNIRSIAWNPLGTWVATGSADKTLRVWNVDKPNVRQSTELKGHSGPIEKIAFNPVKELELCSVSSDGTVKFWDVRTRTLINEVKGLGETFTLAWSADGESLIVGNKADILYVLSPTQNTPVSSHQQDVPTNQVVFCWSKERIYVTTGEGRTRILSFPEFNPVYTYDWKDPAEAEMKLTGHTSSCISAALHPYNKYLVTGGTDALISIWDTTEWNCVRTITKMVGPVRSISLSFCGNYVAGGSDEGNGLEIAYIETGEPICTFKTASPSPVVAWAPNRYALAYSDLGTLRIISAGAK
ncbi:WD domain-containing protein [Pseudomassariella vexata]|uniref:WD domain-containing protein n=1 Tax=Pseudomassariella vexata TaxID=1141098 RepID=A0A1Y2DSP1_9PEZI|nr:WD domain-containing protein [Pseudomassariella vexata]ORY62303.1 WD domain-containing protein [Pseudomassariella vexata]